MAKNADKGATKPAKKKDKEKKGLRLIRFFKEVFGELKKLTWPTPKELANYTLTVIAFVLVMAVVIGLLDFLFGNGISLLSKL